MPFPSLVCALIETSINQLLTLDNSAKQRLEPLQGKAIKLTLHQINQPLYFFFGSQRVEIFGDYEGELAVDLTVSISALGQLQDNSAITKLIKSDQLVIVGDIKLLQQFGELLTHLDIDWAEHLSHYTGDVIAYHAIENIKTIASKLSSAKNNSNKQMAEYLTQELKLAPSKLEFVHFSDQVAQLNAQLDALELTVAQLR